jgi:hypothetical protein
LAVTQLNARRVSRELAVFFVMRDRLGMTWVLIAVVLIALTAVAFSFRGKEISIDSTAVPAFTPNPVNDKIILVKGWNEVEIRKIINDFIETYKTDGYPAYAVELHKEEEGIFRLTFSKDIHPRLFTFLVNYITYPFDLDFKNRSVMVGAKTTLSADFDGVDMSLVGKRAILYIPQDDQDHDVVYMQTESGINLANSFTEGKWKRVDQARLSSEVKKLIGGI